MMIYYMMHFRGERLVLFLKLVEVEEAYAFNCVELYLVFEKDCLIKELFIKSKLFQMLHNLNTHFKLVTTAID